MPATESNFRDVKKVHVVFALTSIILLFTTLWMMGADQAREWTGYQRKFDDLQTRKQLAAITAIEKSPQYETSKADIDAKKESAAEAARIDPAARSTKPTKNLRRRNDYSTRSAAKCATSAPIATRRGPISTWACATASAKSNCTSCRRTSTRSRRSSTKPNWTMQQRTGHARRGSGQGQVDLTKSLDDANAALTQAEHRPRPSREGAGQARSHRFLRFQEADHGVADHQRLQFAAQDHAGLAADFDDSVGDGPHGAV